MTLTRFTLVLVVCIVVVDRVVSESCTSKDLSVFNQVSYQVQQCTQASGVQVSMPPTMPLPLTSKATLCKSPSCKSMLGRVDDLYLPKCEILFNGKNMTLQTGIDLFASVCDSPTPAPSPMKKKLTSSSSSGSGSLSGYGHKRSSEKKKSLAVRHEAGLVALLVTAATVLVGALTLVI
uniref:Elicitin n=1 Tax=Globisporangium ultimum (strain ATCC 200006 / CBS 805.95 / DAOM BR144) TaxID=431595 RepID=K3WZG1_GLOUD